MRARRNPGRVTQAGGTEAILRHWREAVPDDRVAHLVKDAMRGLARALQTRLARHHVSFGHWTFLRILWVRDGLTQRALSEEAGVMEPTTHAALRALERLGLIRRRRIAPDRRSMHIFLTPRGHALKHKLVPLAEEVNRVALRGLSSGDIAVARRCLLAMIFNLAGDEFDAAGKRRGIPSTRELGRRVARAATATRARSMRARKTRGQSESDTTALS
ncbi:MAG: MarR family transcriptional regulator [Proteobacteria bacterium]|nr:MarR family transcriptional regulator [Pseudomonadota bacterium]